MTRYPNIILASGSSARCSMLTNIGLDFKAMPADIDEKAVIEQYISKNAKISDITEKLASEKARHISQKCPEELIIGSDQTLEFQGDLLSKAKNREDAKAKLILLRGNTHTLRSSVCVVLEGDVVFSHTDTANLTMHDFDDGFLENYMKKDPDALTSCVGGYKIEGAGAWLFSSVKGDVFTIMGMPLLPLLAFLRSEYGVKP